jgi:hypothetical protein
MLIMLIHCVDLDGIDVCMLCAIYPVCHCFASRFALLDNIRKSVVQMIATFALKVFILLRILLLAHSAMRESTLLLIPKHAPLAHQVRAFPSHFPAPFHGHTLINPLMC